MTAPIASADRIGAASPVPAVALPAAQGAGPAAGVDRVAAADAVDVVTLSATAVSRQHLDAAVLGLQHLSALVGRLDQLGTPGSHDDLAMIGEVASEIAIAVEAVGAGFSAVPGAVPLAESEIQASGTEPDAGLAVAGLAARLRDAPPRPPDPLAPMPEAASIETSLWAACTAAAIDLLKTAGNAMAGLKSRLQGAAEKSESAIAPSTAGVIADMAQCEAQIAATMARVSHGPLPSDWPGIAPLPWQDRAAATLARHLRALAADDSVLASRRMGFVAVLLCAACLSLWLAATLDLRLARLACGGIAVVLGAGVAWHVIGTRLPPRHLSIALDPDREE